MGLTLFFSYGRNEEEALAAGHIVESLKGIYFIDKVYKDDELVPGDNWKKEVLTAARNADIFIYFISEKSLNSEYCLEELNEFKSNNAEDKVVPVYFQLCDHLLEKKEKFNKLQSLPLYGPANKLKPYIDWDDLNRGKYKSIKACEAIATGVRRTVQKCKKEIEKEIAENKAIIKADAELIKSKVKDSQIELFEKVLARYLENFSIGQDELEPLQVQKLLLSNYYRKQNTAFEKCSLVESELKRQFAGYELYIGDDGPRVTLLPFELYQLNQKGELQLKNTQIEVDETIKRLRSMLNKRNLQRRIRVMGALTLN